MNDETGWDALPKRSKVNRTHCAFGGAIMTLGVGAELEAGHWSAEAFEGVIILALVAFGCLCFAVRGELFTRV